jgi:hypothetical protein
VKGPAKGSRKDPKRTTVNALIVLVLNGKSGKLIVARSSILAIESPPRRKRERERTVEWRRNESIMLVVIAAKSKKGPPRLTGVSLSASIRPQREGKKTKKF